MNYESYLGTSKPKTHGDLYKIEKEKAAAGLPNNLNYYEWLIEKGRFDPNLPIGVPSHGTRYVTTKAHKKPITAKQRRKSKLQELVEANKIGTPTKADGKANGAALATAAAAAAIGAYLLTR